MGLEPTTFCMARRLHRVPGCAPRRQSRMNNRWVPGHFRLFPPASDARTCLEPDSRAHPRPSRSAENVVHKRGFVAAVAGIDAQGKAGVRMAGEGVPASSRAARGQSPGERRTSGGASARRGGPPHPRVRRHPSRPRARGARKSVQAHRSASRLKWRQPRIAMPTALDNGRRSPRKLLRAVVARLLGRKGYSSPPTPLTHARQTSAEPR